MEALEQQIPRPRAGRNDDDGREPESRLPRPILALGALQILTGAVLLFFYRPGWLQAPQSLLDLEALSSLRAARNLHAWGGHALTLGVALLMLREILRGGYRRGAFLWTLLLLGALAIFGLAVSGALLPGDGRSLALAEIVLGEGTPGDGFVLGAYLVHILILPAVLGVVFTLWRRRSKRSPQGAGGDPGRGRGWS